MGIELTYIIILNWNNWQDTIECVRSCYELDYREFRIVVVDNGSEDNSEQILKSEFPDLKIIQTGANLGFAGGNNIGITYALQQGAKYVWLLNNDTVVEPAALANLVSALEKDSESAAVGSKIRYFFDSQRIWFAGGMCNYSTGETEHLGMGEIDKGQCDVTREVDYITGCSLLARCSVIRQLGVMQEEYFLYFEETDWCTRIRRNGYKLIYVPQSLVFHKESASTGVRSPLFYYYMTRNRLYFLKQRGINVKWDYRVYKDLRLIAHFVKARNNIPDYVWAVIQGYTDFIFGKMGQRK